MQSDAVLFIACNAHSNASKDKWSQHPSSLQSHLAIMRSRISVILSVEELVCNVWYVLQGCTSGGGTETDADFDPATGSRLFRFWVTDRRGDKLDYARCTALIYTMGLLLGKSNAPLRPPGSSFATITDTGGSAVL